MLVGDLVSCKKQMAYASTASKKTTVALFCQCKCIPLLPPLPTILADSVYEALLNAPVTTAIAELCSGCPKELPKVCQKDLEINDSPFGTLKFEPGPKMGRPNVGQKGRPSGDDISFGSGSKQNYQRTAGFSASFHLPRFPFWENHF